MLEGEVAVHRHAHAVHIELDVAHLHVVRDERGQAGELAFLRHAIGRAGHREAVGERDGGRLVPVVVGKVVNDLQAARAVRHVGEAVVDGDGVGAAGSSEGGYELVHFRGITQVIK